MDTADVAIALWSASVPAARALGVLLFGTALVAKLRNRDEFTAIVARYLAAPLRSAAIVAAAVIALEGTAALAFLLPGAAVLAGGLAAALLLAFAAAMAAALRRGERELDCGCGSTALRQRVRWPLVARNVVLAALFLLMTLAPPVPTTWIAALDGIAAGVLMFILNLCFGTFVALDDSFAELKRRYG